MDFKIEFLNEGIGIVDHSIVDSFSYIVDINQMYAGSKLVIKDMSKTYYNLITMGQDVDITFYNQKATQKTSNSEGSNSYTNHMKILSFKKNPSLGSGIADKIEIVLISSWYFISSVKTTAYVGSIGSILKTIFDSPDFSNSKIKTDIDATEDNGRIRYQVGQRTQDFCKSILKYGRVGNLPVYLYSDAQGNLRLKGISSFIKGSVKYTLKPDTAELSNVKSKDEGYTSTIRLTDYKVHTDGSTGSSYTKSYFTTEPFFYKQDEQSYVAMLNSEGNNAQSSTSTPTKINYYNWYITPDDALSIASRDIYESNQGIFCITGSTNGLCVDTISLGALMNVSLPYEKIKNSHTGKTTNLGEGVYMVQHVEYIYKNTQSYTTFTLLQTLY